MDGEHTKTIYGIAISPSDALEKQYFTYSVISFQLLFSNPEGNATTKKENWEYSHAAYIRRAKGGAEKCVKISLSQGCTVYYIFNIQNSIIPTCKHLFCAIMAPLYLSCYVLSIFFQTSSEHKNRG